MGITVAFAGLMLICLSGDSDCPTDYTKNTAWVIKAHSKDDYEYNKPCGWESGGANETTLKIRYSKADFECERCSCDKTDNDDTNQLYDCELPTGKIELRLDGALYTKNYSRYPSIYLPRIRGIDDRYLGLNKTRFKDPELVPSSIAFPLSDIGAAPRFPQLGDPRRSPTTWSLSKGLNQQRPTQEHSDQLWAIYSKATYVDVYYNDTLLYRFKAIKESPRITLLNEAEALESVNVSGFQDLAYLLWYYRLGEWRTDGGYCPTYNKQSVLLRCRNKGCNYYGNGKRATIFWPVMRGE